MALSVAAVTKGITREEWLKLRTKGIGGSDAAAVADLNPYKSKVAVFLEKTGQMPPEEAGEAAYWGNLLEDVVAKEFSRRTGLKIQRSNHLYVHPEHPFMLGNVDRTITDSNKRRGILEVKTTGSFNKKNWVDAGNDTEEADWAPEHYMIQLQHYLAVRGFDYGFFAVLIGGNDFRYKYVERDERVIKYLIELESHFWKEHVEKNVPPLTDGSLASTNLLSYLYPNSEPDSIVQFSSVQEDLITELREAKEEANTAETRLEAAKNAVKAIMQDSETAMFNGERIATWKTSQRGGFDAKTMRLKHPEIYEEFSYQKPVRTFLIK